MPFEGISAAQGLGEGMEKMVKGTIDDAFIERLVDKINQSIDNQN